MMSFGEMIDIVCWYKHISQSDLGKIMGVSPTHAYRIIHNATTLPPGKLQKLSECLDIPLEVLCMWQGLEIANKQKEK